MWSRVHDDMFMGTQTVCYGSPYIILLLTWHKVLEQWLTKKCKYITWQYFLDLFISIVVFIRIVCNFILLLHKIILFVKPCVKYAQGFCYPSYNSTPYAASVSYLRPVWFYMISVLPFMNTLLSNHVICQHHTNSDLNRKIYESISVVVLYKHNKYT